MAICKITKKLSIGYFGRLWHWRKAFLRRSCNLAGRRMNQHVCIVGESGGGKSNAAKLLATELVDQGCNVAVLDPHSEYTCIAEHLSANVYNAAYNGINIMDPGGAEAEEKAGELLGMFRRHFRLGYVQSSMLYKCMRYTYNVCARKGSKPTMQELLRSLKAFEGHAHVAEARIYATLYERLSLVDGIGARRAIDIGSLWRSNSILVLSGLHTTEAQSVYMEGFLRSVYADMLTRRPDGRRLFLVIDEAEKLGENPMLGKLAAEGRKYGVGIVAVSQRAKELDRSMLGNAALFLSFYQREPEELNYVANYIAGGNELGRFIEVKKALRSLRCGDAIVTDSLHEPYIVRFGKGLANTPSLSYEILESARHAIREKELFGHLGSKGFSYAETSERLAGLMGKGLLAHFDIGAKGMEGRWYISYWRNSPEHDVSVNALSLFLNARGVRCSVYNKAYGPDISAYSGNESIAIEYETGSKSRQQMEKMLEYRKKAFKRIIVVANAAAGERYEGIGGAENYTIEEFAERHINGFDRGDKNR